MPATNTGSGNFIDALQLLVNASETFPAIQALTLSIATLIGVIMVGTSLLDMFYLSAGNGASWSGASAPTTAGVVTKFFVGAVLVSSAYFMFISANTFIGTSVNTSAMLYGAPPNTYCDKAKYAVFFLVALVGQIAFVRGWIVISKVMNQSRQDGMSTGITFILGGTACYFLPDLGEMLAEWFGVNLNLNPFCA
jgi:hypothetical protein